MKWNFRNFNFEYYEFSAVPNTVVSAVWQCLLRTCWATVEAAELIIFENSRYFPFMDIELWIMDHHPSRMLAEKSYFRKRTPNRPRKPMNQAISSHYQLIFAAFDLLNPNIALPKCWLKKAIFSQRLSQISFIIILVGMARMRQGVLCHLTALEQYGWAWQLESRLNTPESAWR